MLLLCQLFWCALLCFQVYFSKLGGTTNKRYSGRLQAPSSDHTTKNASIMIRNMQPSDTGVYTCEVEMVFRNNSNITVFVHGKFYLILQGLEMDVHHLTYQYSSCVHTAKLTHYHTETKYTWKHNKLNDIKRGTFIRHKLRAYWLCILGWIPQWGYHAQRSGGPLKNHCCRDTETLSPKCRTKTASQKVHRKQLPFLPAQWPGTYVV